jgi:MFS family permease
MAPSEFSARSVSVAASCGVGATLSGATVLINSVSGFIQPITTDLHWSESQFTGLMQCGLIAAGIGTPLIGWLVDRYGPRAVALAGAVAFPLGTMWLAFLGPNLVLSGFLFVVAGIAAPALGAVAFNKVLSAWFEQHRGIMLALVAAGSAAGGVIVPQLVKLLLHDVGWRGAYIGLGLLVCVCTLPMLLLFFREPVSGIADHAGQPTPRTLAVGTSLHNVLRTPSFWLLVAAVSANVFVGVALQIHVVPFLTDRGFNHDTALNLSSLFPLGQVAGQLLAGWLLDRFDTPRVVVPFFVASLAGLLMLDYFGGFVMLTLSGVMLRAGVGAELSIAPYLLVRYFGLLAYGRVYGVLFFVSAASGGIGAQAFSYCHDVTHSYQAVLLISEVLLALGVLLVWRLGPYNFPKHLAAAAEGGH